MAVKVIGAGLAGCEAAWQLAQAGIDVELYEMKPKKFTPAHKYKGFAELVCSNSLKADRIDSAAGMLKEEMRRLGSVTMECAAETKVSAGGALAVDREKFSDMVTAKIMENPHITVIEEEVTDIPDGDVIIATGPLTSDGLAESIGKICGDYLYFHDAAAPIVTYESLDTKKMVLFHHERLDGSGFPMRRRDFAMECRIIQACDAFDSYITGMECIRIPLQDAIGKIQEGIIHKYDRKVVETLLSKIAYYPVGTVVKMSNQAEGIVVLQTQDPKCPVVLDFHSGESEKKYNLMLQKDISILQII